MLASGYDALANRGQLAGFWRYIAQDAAAAYRHPLARTKTHAPVVSYMAVRIDLRGKVIVLIDQFFEHLQQVLPAQRHSRPSYLLFPDASQRLAQQLSGGIGVRLQSPDAIACEAIQFKPAFESEPGNLGLESQVIEQGHEVDTLFPGGG